MSVILNPNGTVTVSIEIDGAQINAAAEALTQAIASDVAALKLAKQEVLDAISQFNPNAAINLASDLAPFMRGYLSGCSMSPHAASPGSMIAVEPGVLTADDGSAVMAPAAGVIDFTQVGANGLDQGAIAPGQWYHCFVISNDNGDTALLASLSLFPAMPAAYTKKRRIGSQKAEANGMLRKLHQRGNYFFWDVPTMDEGKSNPGSSALIATLTVPKGVVVQADCSYYLQSADVTRRSSLVTATAQTATAPAAGVMSTIASGLPGMSGLTQTTFQMWTNTDGQIRHQLDGSGGSTSVFITTRGWFDPL